jgi:hypothetical protein
MGMDTVYLVPMIFFKEPISSALRLHNYSQQQHNSNEFLNMICNNFF